MALAFQVSLTVISLVSRWGTAGIFPTAAALGLTDVDALTVSMSKVDEGISTEVAAQAIAIGVIANTLLKLALSVALGTGRFRRIAAGGLAILALATLGGLAVASRF
jgi:uncharacterized membrane protein (DUF4010 family)